LDSSTTRKAPTKRWDHRESHAAPEPIMPEDTKDKVYIRNPKHRKKTPKEVKAENEKKAEDNG